MLATIKIIPFAAPEAAVARAAALAAEGGPLVRVAPFVAKNVGLVSTRLPGTKPLLLDRNAQSVAARVEGLGGRLVAERRCDHAEAAVGEAVRELLDEGCDAILVFGASAIVDRRDVVPAGIVRAGGHVDHFGMPVDPGNLLLLAHAGPVPVLGLPGCARSPKTNGYDWVLRRIMADLKVTGTDIMRMGGGGLLAEIEARPQPRAGARAATGPAKAPTIAALVLAAGQSRRMGGPNKLLAPVGGKAMVRRVVETALGSGARPVLVVTGHQADAVTAALTDLPVDFAANPDFAGGLSTSLRRGIAALPPDVDGAVVCLGDMPALTPGHIDRLIASFDPVEGRAICVPTVRGKRGNPVLIGAQFFPEIMALEGDIGARHLIGAHADQVCEVPVDALGGDPGTAPIHVDIDTAEALAAYADRQPA
jgi:molybdenum cofactor cytidylyltransferase